MTKAPRTLSVRHAIAEYTDQQGYPPSLDDLSEMVGIGRTSVRYHLLRLRDRGLVTWQPGKSRTLCLAGDNPRLDRPDKLGRRT